MNRIKELLSRKGMTAAELAALLGISPQYISNIINERHPVSASKWQEIADVFQVEISEVKPDLDEPSTYSPVVDRIKSLMSEKGISGREIARKLNMTEQTFSRQLHNNSGLDFIIKVSDIMKTPVYEFFVNDSDPNKEETVLPEYQIDNTTVESDFARNVKSLMKVRGLSLVSIADKAYISMPGLSRILSNKGNPSLSTIVKIAGALNVPVSMLFSGDTDNGETKGDETSGDILKLLPGLQAILRERNMAVADLAKLMDLPVSTLNSRMTGKLTIDTVNEIAASLGVPAWSLLYADDSREPKGGVLRLREVLDSSGVGTYDLAGRLGVPHATVLTWIKGARMPSASMLDGIAGTLGVPVWRLFMDTDRYRGLKACLDKGGGEGTADRILRLCGERGVSERDLADTLGVPVQRLPEILGCLPVSKTRKVADLLGVRPEELTAAAPLPSPLPDSGTPITAFVQHGDIIRRADTLGELAGIMRNINGK